MVVEKDTFDGAVRAKAFPIIAEYFLPRARDIWRSNSWISITPQSSIDPEGSYLPPFLHSVIQRPPPSRPPQLPTKPLPQPILSGPSQKKILHFGILWKLGQGLVVDPWAHRFFVLDYRKHTLTYYSFHSSLLSLAAYSTSSSSSSSSAISSSLAHVLLKDRQKVKKGEIHLENKKILFYANDKYSINWLNSSGKIDDKVMASSTGSSFKISSTIYSQSHVSSRGEGQGSREGYIIEIVYLKSVADSKRSNMILLTYDAQIGKEWAEALTYVTASATKYRARKDGNSLDYNDLRDEMRDSLASFHGLLPTSSTTSSSTAKKRNGNKITNPSSPNTSSTSLSTEEADNSAAQNRISFLSRLHNSVLSMDVTSLFAILLDIFDIIFVSTFTNLYHDLTVNGNVILFPFFILLCPQHYQPPLFLFIIYVLLYSNRGHFHRRNARESGRDSTG